MTTFKSTMGAPLTEEETSRIRNKWYLLETACAFPSGLDNDPVQMLSHITDIIMACWEVRRAIDEGWYQANKRIEPVRMTKTRHFLADLKALGVTHEQLIEALKDVEATKNDG